MANKTEYVPLDFMVIEKEKEEEGKYDDKKFYEKIQKQLKNYEISKEKERDFMIDVMLERIKEIIDEYSTKTPHRSILFYIVPDGKYPYPRSISYDSKKTEIIILELINSASFNILNTRLKKIGFEIKRQSETTFFKEKCTECKFAYHPIKHDMPRIIGFCLLISWKRDKKTGDPFFYKIKKQTECNREKIMNDIDREISEQFENMKRIIYEKSNKGQKKIHIIFTNDSKYCNPSYPWRVSEENVILHTKYYLGKGLGKQFMKILISKLNNLGFFYTYWTNDSLQIAKTEIHHSWDHILGHYLEIDLENPGCQIL